MRVLLGLTRKVEDLVEQKAMAQKELKTFVGLANAAQSQLSSLGLAADEETKSDAELQTMNKPSLLRTTTTEGEQIAAELQKHKKYVYALKFRKAVIAVLAANRLGQRKARRTQRYGVAVGKCGSLSQFLADSLLQTSVPETTTVSVVNRLSSVLPHLSILPSGQFQEGALVQAAMRIAAGLSTAGKGLPVAEECRVVVQALEELQKSETTSELRPALTKEFTSPEVPSSILRSEKLRQSPAAAPTGDIVDFLQHGLASIKGKYSWLHLGVPLELFSADIKYIDTLFYKDLISQEDVKKIERALSQLHNVVQLKGQLDVSKEREDALVKQLTVNQSECKEYEETIKKLEAAVDELQAKQATMVTSEAYEDLGRRLEGKDKEADSLATEIVRSEA